MAYWILKSEPSVYSYDTLVKDKRAVWDGVKNFQALINLRAMKKGDLAFFYHSNEGKCIVGICEITKEAYADPKLSDDRLVVVELVPKKKLAHEVTLSAIKANPKLQELKLVRQSRLSVSPATDAMWKELLRMAGESTE